MAKKLTVDSVKAELELLACGANGGTVEIDKNGDWPTLPQFFAPSDFQNFVWAVKSRFFEGESERTNLFDLSSIPDWATYDTLAAEVIKERKRLDAIAKNAEAK